MTALRRRFLVLLALRWLPTGLLIPVVVLLLLDRGLSIAEIGLASVAQGVMVMALELPTGALADGYGRRAVLLLASAFDLVSISLLLTADSIGVLLVVFALQGVFRALESGPLDAWFVDSAQAVEPAADIEGALGAAGAVLGVSIAAATIGAGALVALDPIPAVDALVVPLLVSLVLRIVNVVAIAVLMAEPSQPAQAREATRRVPDVVREAVHVIRSSTMLKALLIVELLWGAGMVAFETLTPAKLDDVTGSAAEAAAIFGPVSAGAWLASAGAAAVVPRLASRVGAARAGAVLRVAQGATVAAIGVSGGPIGVVIAYLLTMAVHGASNPVHQGLLHRSVEGPANRSTVVSANSLSAQFGGAIGMVGLTALADETTRSTAIVTGAILLVAAAPVYLYASSLVASEPRTAHV